ncbi:MAG: hypothetical protein HUU02_13980 [Bacteroidetes bacterium]|nr:hypothetical protein [Bacteroidota bacterium]
MKTILSLLLLTFTAAVTLTAQDEKTYTITDVEQKGDNIIITYSHIPVGDDPDAEYEVTARITRESNKNFDFELKNVSGAVGSGAFVGKGQRIVWNYKKQFPKGLPYEDITFELTITKNEGIGSWVWYTGGAAVLGVGAAVLLSKPKEEDTSNGSLPSPPGTRPN